MTVARSFDHIMFVHLFIDRYFRLLDEEELFCIFFIYLMYALDKYGVLMIKNSHQLHTVTFQILLTSILQERNFVSLVSLLNLKDLIVVA